LLHEYATEPYFFIAFPQEQSIRPAFSISTLSIH